MTSPQPFNRNFKRRPEQFISKMNKINRQLAESEGQLKVVSANGKQVIIIGQQPSPPMPENTFGIVKYDISGDILNVNTIIV